MSITPRGANPHIDQNGTFLYDDYAGDSLVISRDRDALAFSAEDGAPVILSRDAVRELVVFLHQWLGDADVTRLDRPPGSEWLPTRTDR